MTDDEDSWSPALAGTAAEVSGVLAARRLSPARRELLYRRTLAMVDRGRRPLWRGWSAQRWQTAAVSGAVLALAAGAAIGVALSRDRRHQVAPA
jgi:hypothetical protein